MYAFGTIFYALLGSGEIQPWAMPKKPDPEELQALDDINRDQEKGGEKGVKEVV